MNKLIKMKKPYVYLNDDYTGFEFGTHEFYFGYEQTLCSKCKKKNCEKEEHEDYLSWCFVVRKKNKEIFRYPIKEFDDVTQGFYLGMAAFLQKILK